jgi:hypothetical protein
MVSSAVSISSKAGKRKDSDKQIMGKFLNYCPVISVQGSEMKEYSANRLLQQLKRYYADKVVRNGFDDSNLYSDELFTLNDLDIKKFDELKGIIGTSKAAPKTNDIIVNDQGLTNEEYEETEKLKKKPKKELTEEEKARLEELKKLKKLRNDAISILRGISIRMPLLIYGADIPYEEEITLERFVDMVDDSSWEEFMPAGVTKKKFREFQKYYDEDVFVAAGRRIRNVAKSADVLNPADRIKKIAGLFRYFKNPDKETVLTPWRVVNMHMSDCIGGWDFFDEEHNNELEGEPRFVDRGKVTKDIFFEPDTRILEINSKTGLYPLYVTFSTYMAKCQSEKSEDLTPERQRELWFETVKNNVFVICKTPMAKAITRRTLVGFSDKKINAHYFDDLINIMANKPQLFIEKVTKENYWKKGNGLMKFSAIVGNPPYQLETDGAGRQAKPIYNLFIEQAKKIEPNYLSMITPSRWFAGGMGLDKFRENMISDDRIEKIVDYTNAKDCFPQISISGGVSYFLWNKEYHDDCEFVNVKNGEVDAVKRPLDEFDVLVRYNKAVSIIRKTKALKEGLLADVVSSLMPFGLSTNYRGQETKDDVKNLTLYASDSVTYVSREELAKGEEYIDTYKVLVSKTSAEHAGEPSKEGKFRVIPTSMRVIGPGEVCTHSYFLIGNEQDKEHADNIYAYLTTKYVRFLMLLAISGFGLSKLVFEFVPIQDFSVTWTDEMLYKKYNLSDEEIEFIDSMIKPYR